MRARPQLLRFPPLTKTPLWKPLTGAQDNQKRFRIYEYIRKFPVKKHTERGGRTPRYAALVDVLSNWIPDNWVYRLLKSSYTPTPPLLRAPYKLGVNRREGYLGHDMGGCKTYGGEENVPENALSRKFWTPQKELLVCSVIDSCRGKTEHRHLRGVENVPYEGGPKPLFGRGVIREVFHPPLFPPPLWRPLRYQL